MKRLAVMFVFAFLMVGCDLETEVEMTWKFEKALDQANPTIGLFDHSDNDSSLTSVKLDNKNTTVTVTCVTGNTICFGGDFSLAGQDFEIGCGANCASYDSSYESEWCRECEETTVSIIFDNFLM